MNKKDIGFNGLTKREESFKKKQNKCITTAASYTTFSVEGVDRLRRHKLYQRRAAEESWGCDKDRAHSLLLQGKETHLARQSNHSNYSELHDPCE